MALTTESALTHGKRVAAHCFKIAQILGLSNKTADYLKQTTVYHDIGNVLVPESILTKTTFLSPEEYELVKAHAYNGYSILKTAQSKEMQFSAQLALKHHENLDGSGYPYGLLATDLGIEDRILRVADTFDALISWRPHRPAANIRDAFTILEQDSKTLFDENVVKALKEVMTREVPIPELDISRTQVDFVDDLIFKADKLQRS